MRRAVLRPGWYRKAKQSCWIPATTRNTSRDTCTARRNLVVVTASLAVLEELSGNPGIKVRLTGRSLPRGSHDSMRKCRWKRMGSIYRGPCVFRRRGIVVPKGAMNYDQEMPKSMLRRESKGVLVMDSSKIGIEAVYRFCPIRAVRLDNYRPRSESGGDQETPQIDERHHRGIAPREGVPRKNNREGGSMR